MPRKLSFIPFLSSGEYFHLSYHSLISCSIHSTLTWQVRFRWSGQKSNGTSLLEYQHPSLSMGSAPLWKGLGQSTIPKTCTIDFQQLRLGNTFTNIHVTVLDQHSLFLSTQVTPTNSTHRCLFKGILPTLTSPTILHALKQAAICV